MTSLHPAELVALLTYASAMSFTPGPNTTLATALAAGGGLRSALPFVAAVPVGWALLLAICSTGLGVVATAPGVREALVVLAAAYMLVLAWALARRRALFDARPRPLAVGFGQGVALQFANGKAWINAATIAATWVTIDGEALARFVAVLPVMAAFGFASNFTYALVGASLRRWLAHGRRVRVFNGVLALGLAATAVWMVVQTVASG